jgi:hypothetical protein
MQLSRAACDGMPDCVFEEMPNWKVCAYQTSTPTVVLSYTRYPGLVFDPPCDVGAKFYDPSVAGDPLSRDWVWNLTHSSAFVNVSGLCEMETQPPSDGLVLVLNVTRDLEIRRKNHTVLIYPFERALLEETSYSRSKGYFTLEVWRAFEFPDCEDLPETLEFSGTRCGMVEMERTCATIDDAAYACVGETPTLVSRVNASHVRIDYFLSSALFAPITARMFVFEPLPSYVAAAQQESAPSAPASFDWSVPIVVFVVFLSCLSVIVTRLAQRCLAAREQGFDPKSL